MQQCTATVYALLCACFLFLRSPLLVAATLDASAATVPTIQWQLSGSFDYLQVLPPITSDVSGLYVFDAAHNALLNVDPATGATKWNTSIATPTGVHQQCYTPVIGGSRVFFVCTPNHMLALDTSSGVIQWHVQLADAKFNGESALTYSDESGAEYLFVLSVPPLFNGDPCTLFTFDPASGVEMRQRFGPGIIPGLFSVEANITQMNFGVHPVSGEVIMGARGYNQIVHQCLTALVKMSIPAGPTDPWVFSTVASDQCRDQMIWEGPLLYVFQPMPLSGHFYASSMYFSATTPNPTVLVEFWRFSSDSSLDPAHFTSNASVWLGGASSLYESADGKYFMSGSYLPNPNDDSIPVFSSTDGSVVQQWQNPAQNFYQGQVMYDAATNLVWIVAPGSIGAFEFDVSRSDPQWVWGFSFYQDRMDSSIQPWYPDDDGYVAQLLPIVPTSGNKNGTGLLVYAGFGQPRSIVSIGSLPAPACQALGPDVNDNCGTCDGVTTGITTARNCAMCSASGLCSQYMFAGEQGPNGTCTDQPFPLSLTACNGDPADETVAIIVGCTVGLILVLSLAICYMAQRRKRSNAALAMGSYGVV